MSNFASLSSIEQIMIEQLRNHPGQMMRTPRFLAVWLPDSDHALIIYGEHFMELSEEELNEQLIHMLDQIIVEPVS